MFYLTIVNKTYVTVTLGWHDNNFVVVVSVLLGWGMPYSSIRCENTLFGNYSPKCYEAKRILILQYRLKTINSRE